MQVGNLNVKLSLDDSAYNKGLDSAKAKLKTIGSKITSIGKGLTLGISVPLATTAAASVKFASDLTETLNKVDVAFDTDAARVKAWAKTSVQSMGLAQQSALDTAALFGDMGTSMGLTRSVAADMSMSLTQLSADLASFKNISQDQTETALAAIFTGETESLKRLGIVMTETNLKAFALSKGIKVDYDAMDEGTKVMLRYQYVTEKSKNAIGDFARTSQGFANTFRMTGELLKEVSAQFGKITEKLVTPLLQKFNQFLILLAGMDDKTKTLILKIGTVVAAIGPALIIAGKLLPLASQIGTAVGAIASPIGLTVLAIGALTAGLVYFYNSNEAFANKVKEIFNTMATAVVNTISTFLETIHLYWVTYSSSIIQTAKNMWSLIIEATSLMVTIVTDVISQFLNWIQEWWEKKGVEWLRTVQTIVNGIIDIFRFLVFVIGQLWELYGKEIVDLLTTVLEFVGNFALAVMQQIGGILDFIIGVFTLDWERAWDGIKNILIGYVNININVIQTLVNMVFDCVNAMIKWLNRLGQNIKPLESVDWIIKTTTKDVDALSKQQKSSSLDSKIWSMQLRDQLFKLKNSFKSLTSASSDFSTQVGSVSLADYTTALQNAKAATTGLGTASTATADQISSIDDAMNEVIGNLDTLGDGITEALKNMYSSMETDAITKLDNQIAGLNDQIEALQDPSQAFINGAAVDRIKEQIALLEKDKDAVKSYYDTLADQDNLDTAAKQLGLTGDVDLISELLQKYAPDWQNVGQSFGEALIYGLNSQQKAVADAVSDLFDLVPAAGTIGAGNYNAILNASKPTGLSSAGSATVNNFTTNIEVTKDDKLEMEKQALAIMRQEAAIIAG